MATKHNPGPYDCYAKLELDEPYFLLRGKDPVGAFLVCAWISLRAGDVGEAIRDIVRADAAWRDSGRSNLPRDHPKSKEAETCAEAMLRWCTDSSLPPEEKGLRKYSVEEQKELIPDEIIQKAFMERSDIQPLSPEEREAAWTEHLRGVNTLREWLSQCDGTVIRDA